MPRKPFVEVAAAIAEFEPVTMCVSREQYMHARSVLPESVRVIGNVLQRFLDAGLGPTFVVTTRGRYGA